MDIKSPVATIEMSWDDTDETTLRLNFAYPYSWEDYEMATQYMNWLTMQRGVRIDSISTSAPGVGIPPGNPMAHYRKSATSMPNNVGLLVLVMPMGKYGFAKLVYASVMRVLGMGDKLRMAGSIKEARQMIETARQRELDAVVSS